MHSGVVKNILSGKERTALRARAHSLRPVVWVGDSGATPGAMREIDRALTAHELIKIHAAVAGREARSALLADICAVLGAQPVQVIGKMLVAFRQRPQAATADDGSSNEAKTPQRRKPAKKAPSGSKPKRNHAQRRSRPRW